jgi:hypothetical protein
MTETEKILYTIQHNLSKAQIDTMYHEISTKEFFVLLGEYKAVIVNLFTEGLVTSDIELIYADTLVNTFNQLCIRMGRIDLTIMLTYGLMKAADESAETKETLFNSDFLKTKKEDLETLFISNIPIKDEADKEDEYFLVCMESNIHKPRIINDDEVQSNMQVVKVPIGFKAQAENNFNKFYEMINYIPIAPLKIN